MLPIRTIIRNKLLQEQSAIVYNSNIVTKLTEKPYIVIRPSGESNTNISMAYDSYYNIFCYVDKGNHTALDELIFNVISILNKVDIGYDNGYIRMTYTGYIGQEYFDIDFDAMGQGLSFKTSKIYE